ncbi:MAG: type VI secretion system tip protein VgrG [Zoogloeaceae bacterium]|jgi:type VI secretion system secreted protein VgrG|nr:type VI secretion system tip protein VgrG [Zoogloeaceae bacterium]
MRENLSYLVAATSASRRHDFSISSPRLTFVAFDDPYSLPQATQNAIRFHRSDATESEDSLTDWTSQRQIGSGAVWLQSFDYKPTAESASQRNSQTEQGEGNAIEATLEDYDPQTLYYASLEEGLDRYAQLRQQAHDRNKKTFFGKGTVRELEAGEWFQLTDHPDFGQDNPEDAEFVVTRLTFSAANNLPRDAKGRQASDDTPAQPYTVALEAQRRGIALAPDFAHSQHAKPTARGTQTALVVGPENEEVYTDEMGRIKIQFHWQRQKEHPEYGAHYNERSSCWVRVAYPIAGAGWGQQFIPRIGQEVIVDFVEDDIDRPLVRGVVYDGRNPPPYFSGAGQLPPNKTLSGIKTKEHFGDQYGELLFDDTSGEVRTKLSSEHGKSQLNQGFLTHPRTDGVAEPRGEGFELRTDRHGALRAAEGLLISTEAKPLAQGKQLDRETAQAQLDSARKIAEELSKTAQGQKADPTETGPETLDEEGQTQQKKPDGHIDHLAEASRAWEVNTNTDLEGPPNDSGQPGRQAILLASAPAGIGLVTPQELVLVAERNLDTVSHRDTQQSTTRRWLHNVGSKISLFVDGVADKVNMKLIAARGHAQLWAQDGDVEIVGEQNVRIHANQGKLEAVAKEELLIACGGAIIRLKGGNIDIHAPANISFKAANYNHSGPASLTMQGSSPKPEGCGGGNQASTGGGAVFVVLQAALPLPGGTADDAPSSFTEAAFATVEEAVAPVTETLAPLAEQAGAALDAVQNAAGSALDAATDMAGSLAGQAGSALDAVQNAAGSALASVQNVADSALGAVQNAAGDALGSVTDMAGSLVGQAGDALGSVTDMAGSLAGQAGDALGSVTDMAGSLAGQADSALSGVADAALGNIGGSLGETAAGALDNVAGGALGAATDAAASLTDAATAALPKDLPGLGGKLGA